MVAIPSLVVLACIAVGALILVGVIAAAHALGWVLLVVGLVLLLGGGYGNGRWYNRTGL